MGTLFNKAQLYSQRFDHKKRIEKELKLLQTTLSAIPIKGSNHVIDLACGPGMHGNWFSEQGLRVTGIDIDVDAIKTASELYPVVNYKIGDMRNIIAEKCALLLFLGNTISNSKDAMDLEKILVSISNVLEPGGILLIHHLNYDPKIWADPKVIVTSNKPKDKTVVTVKTMASYQDRILVNFVYYHPEEEWTCIGQHNGTLRKIMPDEIDPILDKTGFLSLATFGSGACEPFEYDKSNDCFRLLMKPE